MTRVRGISYLLLQFKLNFIPMQIYYCHYDNHYFEGMHSNKLLTPLASLSLENQGFYLE